MSAYVTYDLTGFDADGLRVCKLPIRAVCKPEGHEAVAILREQFGDTVTAAEVQRSIPAKIGRYTPATRRTVSARARVLALSGMFTASRVFSPTEGTMSYVKLYVFDVCARKARVWKTLGPFETPLALARAAQARYCGIDAEVVPVPEP